MNCSNYNNADYMSYAASDLIAKLKSDGFNVASVVLENLVKQLNIFFQNIEDSQRIAQMNQKLEHMMQVVEDSSHQINNEKHYAHTPEIRTRDQQEIILINAILHDTGRIFEIASLGTCGNQINFNHSTLGGKFLQDSVDTSLLDNAGKELAVGKVDEFLTSNIEKLFGEKATSEQLQKLSRLSLMCLPYNLNQLKIADDISTENLAIYCVTHHGDKDIPVDCIESVRPFLENVRISDRIANLEQGTMIDPALITGGKSADEIATIKQPIDIEENREDAPVIDDLTLHELTTGAKNPDGSTYMGVDRGRSVDEYGRKCVYTPMRMFLSRVGWLYADDNNAAFYSYCKQNKPFTKYIDKIRPYLSKEDALRMEKIEACVEKYVDMQISKMPEPEER